MEISPKAKAYQAVFLSLVGLVLPAILMLEAKNRIELFALIAWFAGMLAFSLALLALLRARAIKKQEVVEKDLDEQYELTGIVTREIGQNMTMFSGYTSRSPEPGLLYISREDKRYRIDITKIPDREESWSN